MVQVLHSKQVTTRAPHDCWGCEMPVPIGEKAERTTGIESNRIASIYWCGTCQDFLQALDFDPEEGFHFGELAKMDGYPRDRSSS